MKTLLNKLKLVKNRILGFFPSPIPVGVSEFNSWAQSIIDTYQPAADDRSVKFALCAMIMRLDPDRAYKPKRFFAICLHKGCSAQVAAQVMSDIKEEQKAEALAAQKAALDAAAQVNGTEQK